VVSEVTRLIVTTTPTLVQYFIKTHMEKRYQFKKLNLDKDHMLYHVQEKLNKIADEINQETDRGVALFSASILDDALQKIVLNFMVDHKVSKKLFKYPDPISSFSARLNVSFALGLITETEYNECNLIRSIRNKFAHEAAYSIDFNSKEIALLCERLRTYKQLKDAPFANRPDFNRIVFFIVVQSLLYQWTERAEYALTIRRELPEEEEGKG
jgi:mannitol operon repressor